MAIFLRAVLAAALLVWLIPHAEAQRAPRGSYLRTCPEVSVSRNRLTAVCRDRDGQFRQTTLANVDRCVGDIGNIDGRLRCRYGAPAGRCCAARRAPTGRPAANVALSGNTLVATCRTMKGRMQRIASARRRSTAALATSATTTANSPAICAQAAGTAVAEPVRRPARRCRGCSSRASACGRCRGCRGPRAGYRSPARRPRSGSARCNGRRPRG